MGLFSAIFDRHPNMTRKQLGNIFAMMDDPEWQLRDMCSTIQASFGEDCYVFPFKEADGVLKADVFVGHKHGGRAKEQVVIGRELDKYLAISQLIEAVKRLRAKTSPFPPELVQIPGRKPAK